MMDHLPKRRPKGTISGLLVQKLAERADGVEVGKRSVRVVACSRHSDRELGSTPCVFSKSLQGTFSTNALVRIVSKQQPELRFYARTHPRKFVQSVKGISILAAIAEAAKINDKDVELREVSEEEARLCTVVMVISDRYLSKRDFWHMHLPLMQEGGEVLYARYDHNLQQHIPNSRIEKLTAPEQRSVFSGVVSQDTEVSFKSYNTTMFVLLQLSAELWTTGLGGRPYWEVLLECFAQFVEKSLKASASDGNGHYIRFVLFARARAASQTQVHSQSLCGLRLPTCSSVACDGSCLADVLQSPPQESVSPLTASSGDDPERDSFMQKDGGSNAYENLDHEDFYSIIWEGFAKAMPPEKVLIGTIRQLFMDFHGQVLTRSGRIPNFDGCRSPSDAPSGTPCHWEGIDACNIVEASKGNVLECLNIVLDYFDQHHLDRCLTVTGQPIVLLTAGNGIVHTDSRALYELTYKRVVMAGPSSFHMICVREPPLHHAPWVQWPGGPDPGSKPEASLPSSPPWMELSYYREADFCSCGPNVEWLRSALLPLERFACAPLPLHVPKWDEALCDVKPTGSKPDRDIVSGSSDTAGAWDDRFPRAGQELWDHVRCPRLPAYFHSASEKFRSDTSERVSKQGHRSEYTVQPGRFSYGYGNGATIDLMNDLIGLRLETIRGMSLSCHRCEVEEKACRKTSEPPAHPWIMQGHLLPENLQRCVVGSADGMSWLLDPVDCGLTVLRHEPESAPAIVYSYKRFFVRRNIMRSDARGENLDRSGICASTVWAPCRRVFYLPPRNLEWNNLDNIVAGSLPMPAALPYPITDSTQSEHCPGWALRNAVKQHLYAVVSRDEAEGSHAEHFAHVLRLLGGSISLGDDPFSLLESLLENALLPSNLARQKSVARFEVLKKALDDLCFGKLGGNETPKSNQSSSATLEDSGRPSLDISCDPTGTRYIVHRMQKTVEIRNVSIASSFNESRDWFDIFYDHLYAPPRCFIMVLQWIVCSSNHLVNFVSRLSRVVEDNGFTLLKLPIAQLFPQPAPAWIWSDDIETNFQRLPLHPGWRIPLPASIDEDRGRLYADLLQCWLQPPLNFVFVFASPTMTFKCVAMPRPECKRSPTGHNVFQRLKGWVLSDRAGLCFVALREEYIVWHENRLSLAAPRDYSTGEQRQRNIERLRGDFYSSTQSILLSASRKRAELLPCEEEQFQQCVDGEKRLQ